MSDGLRCSCSLGANWIAQDYFSPQGFALAIGLGVFAMALHWLKGEQRAWATRLEAWAAHLVRGKRLRLEFLTAKLRQDPPITSDTDRSAVAHLADRSRVLTIVAVLLTFAVLTFVHELSPYIVAVQLGALVAIGLIRPWWLVVAMLAIAVGFLAPNFTYVNNTYGITASIGNFFANVQGPSANFTKLGSEALTTAQAARVLGIGMWGLALVGVLRRLRHGQPAIALAVLAFSPLALIVLIAYGNEAVLRAYLFSLPWTACLAASALKPGPEAFWHPRVIFRTIAIAAIIVLFLVAFFGEDGSSVMTPTDMQASEFLYSHASPGPVMFLDNNFPAPLSADSYEFVTVDSLLGSDSSQVTGSPRRKSQSSRQRSCPTAAG